MKNILESFNESMAKDFVKMFPKYKIPYLKEFAYYLNVQSKLYEDLETHLLMYLNSYNTFDKEKFESYKDYKYSFMNSVIRDLKDGGDLNQLNELKLPEHNYSLKENKQFKEEKLYLSLDLISANFQVLNKYIFDSSYSDFREFIINYTQDECLINSKTIRQFIFGNLNPKRLISLQKYEMHQVEKELIKLCFEEFIFSKNADEIVLEFDNYNQIKPILELLKSNFGTDLKLRPTIFGIKFKEQVDRVIIKETYDNTISKMIIEKELIYGRGDRFFLNLPSILPSHKFDIRDSYSKYLNNIKQSITINID